MSPSPYWAQVNFNSNSSVWVCLSDEIMHSGLFHRVKNHLEHWFERWHFALCDTSASLIPMRGVGSHTFEPIEKEMRELPWLVATHAPRALIYIHGVITGLLSLSHLIIFPHGPPPGNWTNFSRPCIQMRENIHSRCSECWERREQLTKSATWGVPPDVCFWSRMCIMFWIHGCIL